MRVGSLIENYDEYQLACIALNEYIKYGDPSLLEAYSNADIDFLLEATDEEKRLGLSKREIKRRRKVEMIPQEVIKRGAFKWRYNANPSNNDLEDSKYPNWDPKSLKNTEDSYGINFVNRSSIDNVNKLRFGDNGWDYLKNLHLSKNNYNSKDRLQSLHKKGIPVRNYKQIRRVLNLDKAKNGYISYAILNKDIDDDRLGNINDALTKQGYRPVSRENLKDPNFTLRKDTTPGTPKGGFDLSRLGGKKIEVHKSDTSTNYQNPNGNKTTTQSEPSEDNTKTGNKNYRKLSGMTLKKKSNQASSIANVINNNDASTTTSQKPEQATPIPSNPPKTEEGKKEAVKQTEAKMKNVLSTADSKPKNVLARMVASLQNLYRKWLDKKNQAAKNGGDVGFFSNICRIILNCIDKLMWKIRNWSDNK